jgi:molecular chaperone GrpE
MTQERPTPAADVDAQPAAPAGVDPAEPGPRDPAPESEEPRQSAGEPQPSAEQADGAAPEAAPDAEAEVDAEAEAPAKPEIDWHDYALRTQADFENYKKLAAQRVQKASRDSVRRLALELLPALDNFERALASAEAEEADAEHHLTKGIRLVQADLLAAVSRAGIEPYSPQGERFDPHRHEAVAQQPVEGAEPGTIVEVYQQGYRFGDDVLRAAKVVVAA